MAMNENFLENFRDAKVGEPVVYHTGGGLWYAEKKDDGSADMRRYRTANEAWDLCASGRATLVQKAMDKSANTDRHFQYIAIKRKA